MRTFVAFRTAGRSKETHADPERHKASGVIRLLKERLMPYWRQIVLVLALLFVQAITNLYLPTLNADIINNGVVKGNTHHILVTGAYMMGVTLVLVIATVIAVYWGSKTAMAFGRDVRGALFRKVESFSQAELNHFGTPSLITRATNDVQQVQMVVLMMLNLTLAAPIMAIGGIIMALRLDVPLSSVILVAVPVMGVFIGLVLTRALPLFRSMQKKIDRINQVTREVLSGVRVIRAFDRVGYEEQRFDVANADLTGTTLKVTRLFAVMMPTLTLILSLSTVAIVWFGSLQVANHGMPIGDLTAFLMYIQIILMSVLMATIMLVMVPRASASAERIQQVLHAEISVKDAETPVIDAPVRGHVEFRDVEFRYPGAEEPVLNHISFTSAPGQVTAIVGSTGSGKSTLINLIPRFYDVTGGSVCVDGVDVREMDLQDLWHRIGLVPQKAFLFSGTVADNLRYGDEEASDEELWHFLEIAQGTDFVSEMPEELEAPVDQGGANVSGGQRQRLAIARALAKKAKVQIYDDSFSALDFTTDARLRAALKKETTDATVIIVAQRVGTVMHADQIIVLEDGTIAGKGTHEELLKTSETYREIVESQLGVEGVA
jgi:ATP-binding cassette subfamily B protein